MSQACRLLNVSRSGYYAAKTTTKRQKICVASVHLKAAFAQSQQTFGSRRLRTEMHKKGIRIGRYKIRRLMREARLVPVWKRKFVNTTDSTHTLPVADNLLNRQFNPEHPNQAWAADITYIRTHEGFAYLAVVLDLFSRRVVGWAMQGRQTTNVVLQALLAAVWRRKPKNRVLVHSDQGSQFTSMEWASFLKHHNLEPSMSRRGNCHDNAVAESFFNLLKRERIRRKVYRTRAEARQDVFDYIEMFYNPTRKHARNGMLSPVEFERQHKTQSEGV